MQFLYPTFLLALGALAIPIIIHLFYFRRFKKVYFTNVKFLKEVKEETSSRNKLKNLLVLLMRLFAVAFLVFAFAQPFIPTKEDVKKGLAAVSVFVDNSYSMSALSQEVPLIELAREKAREVIQAYTVEDRIQILTHDFEGRHQRMYSKEEALTLIDEIELSPSVKNITNILGRQKQTIASENLERNNIYMISDFQKSISDIENINDSLYNVNFIPLQSVQEKNITIDTCWFDAPVAMLNQTNKLIVRLTNYSEDDAENIRLSLKYENQTQPLGSFDIKAQSSIYDTANITVLKPGWQSAELSITDYPVQFDDKYKFSFNVDEDIKILSINSSGDNKYLNAAFLGINYFTIENQEAQNVNYARLPEFDLIVLNDLAQISSGLAAEINQYILNGGNTLMFPGLNSNLRSINDFLNIVQSNTLERLTTAQKQVSDLNKEEFIFSDVFESQNRNITLPVSQQSFELTTFQSKSEEPILRYRDGSSYLGKYQRGKGHFYLCSAPLQEDKNNLVRNAEIFVPMLYKMAVSTGVRKNISYVIGKDYNIETDKIIEEGDIVYKIEGPEEFIPGQYKSAGQTLLNVSDQLKTEGFYNLVLNQEQVSILAFNYDRKESDMAYYSLDELKSLVSNTNITVFDNIATADFTNIIGESEKGVVLWRWCIILALIFLGLEILLLRLWKTN
jgi:hypothetical protein